VSESGRLTVFLPDGFRKEARPDRQEAYVKFSPFRRPRYLARPNLWKLENAILRWKFVCGEFGWTGVDILIQAPSVSTDIRVTPSNVSTHHGESPRVLTTVSEDDSRVPLLCHRYVEDIPEGDGGTRRPIFQTWTSEPSSTFVNQHQGQFLMVLQIGYGSNKKTRHMMPSGHKAFLVNNVRDVDLLLMHNRTFAAEYVRSMETGQLDSVN
jgi:hypothetical protein